MAIPSLAKTAIEPFTCRLPSRSLLRVSGTDTTEFLQGLFTNDLRLFRPGGSMWGCFLFFTGRVLCDAYLYHCRHVYQGQSAVLLDVHQDRLVDLQEHLLEMKMRKKLKIENISSELAVVASVGAPPPSPDTVAGSRSECFVDPRSFALFSSFSSSSSSPPEQSIPSLHNTATEGDAILAHGPQPSILVKTVMPVEWAPQPTSTAPYEQLLFKAGVGEGPEVFRMNKTLPFEGNVDFLEGVNFHKGCYVGQELTHRTHVMLVTRKRTIPLRFSRGSGGTADGFGADALAAIGDGLYVGTDKIGEVAGVCGDYGIGLVRLRYVDKESKSIPGLALKNGSLVHMSIPQWWPPKQVMKLLKNN